MHQTAVGDCDSPQRGSCEKHFGKGVGRSCSHTQLEHFVELGIIVVKGQQPSSHGRVEEAAAQASSCLQSLALCIGSSSEGWDCREVQPQWLDLILKEVEGWDGEASWQQYVMKRMK
jgi:hypothetical protein